MTTKIRLATSTCAFVLGLAAIGSTAAHADDFDPMGKLTDYTSQVSEFTDGRLNISGYVNAHYMEHDGFPRFTNKNLGKPLFQLREASLFADLTVTDNILFSTELETSYDFTNKEVSGREDRAEALFNYYYVDADVASIAGWDTDTYGGLGLRAGRILVPFLSYNENKPNFKQNLMSQPFTAWQIVPVNNVAGSFQQFGWTDIGASVNWNYLVGDTGLLDVKLTALNGLGTDQDVLDSNSVQLDPSGMMKPTVRVRDGLANAKSDWDDFEDVNDDIATAAKISFSPFAAPVDFGFSWYQGKWDKNEDHDLTMHGFHLNYIEKDWSLKGEYVKADVEQTAGLNIVSAAGPAAVNRSTGDYEMSAWYAEGSYTPYRYGSNDQYYVKLIARYDDVDTNDEATFTPFDRSRVTLGAEWEFLNNVRLRYEWQKHKLDDFDNAPSPFVSAGGRERVYMNMVSIIAHF